MTEISPRHRHTTAQADQHAQSACAVVDVTDPGAASFMDLLSELGLPAHFLADIDPDLLTDEAWDHIPDLTEDLDKGAKEVAFNFDWSWLQHDVTTPPQPVIARSDWRAPPPPSMLGRRTQEIAGENVGAEPINTEIPTAQNRPDQATHLADDTSWVTEAAPVAIPPVEDAPAESPDTPWLVANDAAPEQPTATITELPAPGDEWITEQPAPQAIPAPDTTHEILSAPQSFAPDMLHTDGIIADAAWAQPMSVSTPLNAREQKKQQARLATQARAEAKIAARTAKRQQKLEQAAETSLARAAILLEQQARKEARQQTKINAQAARTARYNALATTTRAHLQQLSRHLVVRPGLMLRLSTGISAIALFSASALWGGSQIEWRGLGNSLGEMVTANARHARLNNPEHTGTTGIAEIQDVKPMSFQQAAITPPPAPDMKVAPLPQPLAISPEAPTETKPETKIAAATPAVQPAAQQIVSTSGLPADITNNQPVDNAPADEKPLPIEIAELRKNAIAGNRQAQHDLGAFYAAGRQIERDFVRAAYWFREAAMRGVPNAQYNLGVLLQRGLGVPQDTVMATQWYQRAARNNHPEAQYNLGVAYADGIGLAKNPRLAAEWFEKAAVGGLARAAFNLGVMYELGMNGPADIDRAIRWYARAAEAGERDARESLDRLNIAAADIAGLASELAQDLAQRYPAMANENPNDQLLNSDQIAEAQSLLSALGLYRGSADGQMGSKTVRAITNFQEKIGLPATGKATESLLAALRRQAGGEDTPFQ